MKVHVVVSDCGLNGTHVHGVFTEPPVEEDIQRLVTEFRDWPDGWRGVVTGTTGYSGTQCLEFELDGPLQ